ncbi:hypothetical protein [Candidatus Nitrotoga arctica]|nr:hypothetical protein [Candidatus Nitrotoga arctica]
MKTKGHEQNLQPSNLNWYEIPFLFATDTEAQPNGSVALSATN